MRIDGTTESGRADKAPRPDTESSWLLLATVIS